MSVAQKTVPSSVLLMYLTGASDCQRCQTLMQDSAFTVPACVVGCMVVDNFETDINDSTCVKGKMVCKQSTHVKVLSKCLQAKLGKI